MATQGLPRKLLGRLAGGEEEVMVAWIRHCVHQGTS